MPGDERGHAERVRDRHRDEARVERRRMDRHVEVLQQRVEPAAVGRRLRHEGGERIVVHHHDEDEEHLRRGDDGDDPGDQLAMALTVDRDRNRPEDRQQKDPEHDRAVESAPVGRDPVAERLRGIGVVLDVLDRVIADEKRADDDRRRDRHQRGGHVEGADAALDEPARSPASAGDAGRERVAGHDEGREEDEGSERSHAVSPQPFAAYRGCISTGTSP